MVASRWTLNSVTASAIALSRHRFSVRNWSTLNGASRSTARSVIAWQERNTVLQLFFGGSPPGPLSNFGLAPGN
jgi:hypothetical protein